MKTISTLFLLLLPGIFLSLHATNYTNSGSSQNYNLKNGDTLRVTNGTYSGNLTSFIYGAVVIVAPGATFKPGAVNTPAGKMINYGTCEFGSFGTYSGFKFENYNLLVVKGNLSLYNGATQTWTNNVAATIKIAGNFSMEQAVFTNFANMTVSGDFCMYSVASTYTNRGLLTVVGDVALSSGILKNENRIVADDFNAWGGQVTNEGSIQPKGDMVFSAGTAYTNKCLLVTAEGFTNYGNFTNNGLLWVGRTGTNNDHFLNSGTFTNSSDAVVRSVKFTNYSILAGGGSYYITGDTYTSGQVGTSANTTDTIKVYDVTRSNNSRIFDVQWGTVASNVVYRPFTQPDTNSVNYAGCASYYRMDLGLLLPIEWNYFTAKPVQNQPVISWSAQFEANMKFEVERSFDNASFTALAVVKANSTTQYHYTDENAGRGKIIYYRIKAISTNGTVKYTETKTVKINGVVSTATVYPNPVRNVASLQLQSERNEQITITVTNSAGHQLMAKEVMASRGLNTFSLTEASQWKAGVYFLVVIQGTEVVSSEQFIKQ